VASAAEQMSELLASLEGLSDTNIVLTLPNADTDGRVLFDLIERFVAAHPNTKAYTSLGQQRYLSCVREVDGVVGNSSSGLTEVPSFRKGTVNIGDRQRGRLRAATVIDCAPDRVSITAAINELYSPEFKAKAALATNPYGDGGASDRIVDIVRSIDLDGILKKDFHDLPIDLARYA
jgi:GDP/UDP-N,N'-diacetylbacillosamine 2-epimerase (hydrolysing)